MNPPGLRERKKVRTAAKIEEIALRLFSERGYDATTVDEIAAEAEIAPRTFFRYFPSKEDVVLGHYEQKMTLLRSALAKRPGTEAPMMALRHAFHEVGRDFEAHHEALLRRTMLIATTPSLRARNLELQIGWERVIAEAIAARRGVEANDMQVRLVAACAVAAMRVALERWVTAGGTASLPEQFDRCLDLVERGLGD